MNFSTDQDLLALEPAVFNDVSFAAQQVLAVSDGALDGATLTSAAADFEAAGVDGGSVVLISSVPHAVVERTNAQTLVVRPTALADGTSLEVSVRSFAAQAAIIHDVLLRLLGIDVDEAVGGLTEDAVVSLSAMARLEALGTLEQVYGAAVAVAGDHEVLMHKAREYRLRYGRAVRSARVKIDVTGDGLADETRHLGLVRWVRA